MAKTFPLQNFTNLIRFKKLILLYEQLTMNVTDDYQEHNGRRAECIHTIINIKYLITGIKFGFFLHLINTYDY